jgi:hypothetical protein
MYPAGPEPLCFRAGGAWAFGIGLDLTCHSPRCFKMALSLGVKKVEKLLQRDRDFSTRVEIMEMNLREKSKKKYFITIP